MPKFVLGPTEKKMSECDRKLRNMVVCDHCGKYCPKADCCSGYCEACAASTLTSAVRTATIKEIINGTNRTNNR